MDHARLVLAILVELFKHQTAFRFAIKSKAIVTANLMLLAKIVTNVKLDSGILQVEKDVRAASAMTSALITHRVTPIPDNVSANQELQDCVAINAKLISMDSQLKVAKLVTAMAADQRVHSAMRTGSVHVTIMLKAEPVTDAKKIKRIVILDAWIAKTVTTWSKTL